MKTNSISHKLLLTFSCLFFLAFTIVQDGFLEKIKKSLLVYQEQLPQEKIYVHTDKPYYTTGERIWFKTYLANGTNHSIHTPSQLVYVELIAPNNKILDTKYIQIKNGGGAGDFELNHESQAEGVYLLRAYTKHMLNYEESYIFQKNIPVWRRDEIVLTEAEEKRLAKAAKKKARSETGISSVPETYIDVQFFPEGGDLVHQLSSRIGLKAVDETGKSIHVEGKVLDENNQFITAFQTFRFGLGVFNLKPDASTTYYAQVTYGGKDYRFPLPDVLKTGLVMNVKNDYTHQKIIVDVSGTPEQISNEVFIVAHIRGILFGAFTGVMTPEGVRAEIPLKGLPDGVAHFTVFDAQERPQCERLIFIQNAENELNCHISSDQEVYDNRSKVRLNIELKDLQEKAMRSNLSLSVTDKYLVNRNPDASNIKTYLLLESDIQGHIEQPNWYFADESNGRKRLLDLLMMTQAWRRFDWKTITKDRLPRLKHPAEQAFAIRGRITKLDNENKPIQGASVVLTTLENQLLADEAKTNELGQFSLGTYLFMDTTDIVLQARVPRPNKNKKRGSKTKPQQNLLTGKKNVSIFLDPTPSPTVQRIDVQDLPATAQDYLAESRRIHTINRSYDMWSIDLNEVTIRAKKTSVEEFESPFQLYARPNHRLNFDSINNVNNAVTILDILRSRVPSLQVVGVFPEQKAILRGAASFGGSAYALIVIDGVQMQAADAGLILPSEVHYVDVLTGVNATLYGGRGSGGVIAIYTKKGAGRTSISSRLGIIDFEHPGFYTAKSFYHPNYAVVQEEHNKPDYRNTLFWTPMVFTDSTGVASIEFYTSDKSSTYDIKVEGISESGIPVYQSFSFHVE